MVLFKKYNRLLTYYNFVEYIIPALIFILLVYCDFVLIMDINIFERIYGFLMIITVSLATLFFMGWLMYITRFYQLFPGYKGIKLKFREEIAGLFPDQLVKYGKDKEKFGKYIFERYWQVVAGKMHKDSLSKFVNWVFLVHICNVIMISFAIVTVLFLTKIIITENARFFDLSPKVIFYILGHFLLYIYFRNAALKNLKKSNFFIIDNINRLKDKISRDLPSNLGDYLNGIK